MDEMKKKIIETIQSIFDPEIPVNIYDMGLIYDIEITDSGDARINMTLTSPNCPEAQSLPAQVQTKVAALEGIRSANVQIVWDPPWDISKMSETAKMTLNMF